MTTSRYDRFALRLSAMLIAAAIVTGCGSASPGSTGGSASTAPAANGSPVALPAGFPIGAWTTTITEEDLAAVSDDSLAAIGMSRDSLVKENAGTFTTTFVADGTWSTVQDTDVPVKWPVFRGTYTVAGGDAIDQVTTFPPDFAGDVVRFTWRIEGGRLHLAVEDAPDPVLPVITAAHPWSPVT